MPRPRKPFWSMVDKGAVCWLWIGGCNNEGYGIYCRQKAHRVAYELSAGPIPDGFCVCHRCDTPACVNPEHLFLGTAAENNADRASKGRSKGTFRPGDTHPAKIRRGERHWQAKLSDVDIERIRDMRMLGVPTTTLGGMFEVNPATISRIARGVWRAEG